MALPFIMAAIAIGKGFMDYADSYSESKSLEIQAEAYRIKGEYEKAAYETNAKLATMNAEDAIARGDQDAGTIFKRGRAVRGSQRAALAAQGIKIDSGSAQEIQGETATLSELDMLTVKNNAWREAWGYKLQAGQYTSAGIMAEIQGRAQANAVKNKASATLLAGQIGLGTSVASAAGGLYGSYGGLGGEKTKGITVPILTNQGGFSAVPGRERPYRGDQFGEPDYVSSGLRSRR